MCGRFYIETDDTPDELIALINHAELKARRNDPAFAIPRGEIRPGDHAAVIARSRALNKSVFPMQWGFRMDKRLIINARSETAAQKPTFRASMKERRCVIPVSAYFEWDHRCKPLVKYRFEHPGSPVMYLAGLYRLEEAAPLPAFTILTRDAAQDIACFHDRMPVILPPQMVDDWLQPAVDPHAVMNSAIQQLHWQLAQ